MSYTEPSLPAEYVAGDGSRVRLVQNPGALFGLQPAEYDAPRGLVTYGDLQSPPLYQDELPSNQFEYLPSAEARSAAPNQKGALADIVSSPAFRRRAMKLARFVGGWTLVGMTGGIVVNGGNYVLDNHTPFHNDSPYVYTGNIGADVNSTIEASGKTLKLPIAIGKLIFRMM